MSEARKRKFNKIQFRLWCGG